MLIFCLMVTFLSGCTKTDVDVPEQEVSGQDIVGEELEEKPIRVASLKGPTSIGLAKLMEDNENDRSNNNYEFTMSATADEIVAKFGKGELDIAAIPANLSSILYNKTDKDISVVAINTLGVLYIVDNGSKINSIEDLKGQTIYSTGKGTTPEHVLNYILKSNNLVVGEDVNIEYKTEATEVASLLASKENIIALLPQPFIAASQAKIDNINIALSLDEEWNKLENDSSLVTGVVIVSNKFLKENKDSLDIFLGEYKESVDYVNNNIEESAELVGNLDIVPAPVAKVAIPLCNIRFIEGLDMKEKLSGYLKVLHEADPSSVGGIIPDEGFYYSR